MNLFYRKIGIGPPLIMLHGLFGSSDNWMHIARALEDSFTIYLPDLRNHGRSPWSDLHGYDAMAEDVIEFAERLGLDRYFIAGHSMGGKTAIYCAIKNPDSLLGLLVADISPFTYEPGGPAEDQHRKVLEAMTTTDPSKFKDRVELEKHLASVAGEDITRYILSKNISYEAGKLRWRLNVASVSSNIHRLLEGYPRPPEMPGLVAGFPVIFLKGSESLYISEKDIPDIVRVFPGARILTAEGAGHWIHTEKPDAVISALLELKALSRWEESN